VDDRLGRGRVPASSAFDVETFNQFFADKVARVRTTTSDAPPPTFSRVRPGTSFRSFSPLTTDDCPTSSLPPIRFRRLRVHITPVKSVRDLGIYIDAHLSMRMHVKKTVSCCLAALRQLRQIRRYVPTSTFQKLVVALVHSRLDYGNGVLVGIPASWIFRLCEFGHSGVLIVWYLCSVPNLVQIFVIVTEIDAHMLQTFS